MPPRSGALLSTPMRSLALALALLLALAPAAAAQKLGYVDSQTILPLLPEYQSARQEVDRMAAQWQSELTAMEGEIAGLEREYQARELLFTQAEREGRVQEIEARRTELTQLRRRHFGPDGDLFREEQQRMRPVQERVLLAVETVAEEGGYDFVFDRGGEVAFLYARPTFNLTDLVLEELGVDPQRGGATTAPAGPGR